MKTKLSGKPINRVLALAVLSLCLSVSVASYVEAQTAPYFPPKGEWAKKSPAELGMDPVKLKEAIDFALTRESRREMDFSDQERIFGTLLGSVPNIRAKTNGVIIYKGYVVAEFGDPTWVDPTYSVAKSMLATVTGIAVRDGLIKDLNSTVGSTVKDGGYDSPRNAQVTWKHHLQQTSEWEGNMFGKQDNFIGKEAFGEGEMKPREQMKPGTHYEYNDVRINRFALSLLRTFGKPVPDVFREQVMDPIGASNTWRWIPYHNSFVDVNGRKMASVSGGTRWGGGMWINAMDMARFGYLWLRNGKWGDKQIIPAAFVKEALTQGGVANSPGNGYGYLWWLNTTGKALAGMPTNAFSANGAGSNTITVSPDHDLVIVWRWHQGSAGELGRRVIAAIKPGTM
ncbi:MAG TPA: serine hydrolase [Vicinamibacterales bacterium]|nr:serine hydrolase [Vicinamibacterales bacterium]